MFVLIRLALKLSLRPWKSSLGTQVLNSLVLGILLFSGVLLYWCQTTLHSTVARLKSEQVVTVYLLPATPEDKTSMIADEIKLQLGSGTLREGSLAYTGVNEFVQEVKKNSPELSEQLFNLAHEMPSLVPRFWSFDGNVGATQIEKIKAIPGVEEVETTASRMDHWVSALETLSWLTRYLILGVLVCLVMMGIHSSRAAATQMTDALRSLRMWGGGWVGSRFPAFFSGIWGSLLASVFAGVMWWGMSSWVGKAFIEISPAFQGIVFSAAQGAVLLGFGSLSLIVLSVLIGGLSVRSTHPSSR